MVTQVTLQNGKILRFARCLGVVDLSTKDPVGKDLRWAAQRTFGRSKLVWFKDEDVAKVQMEQDDQGGTAFNDPPKKVS